jgi:hypothetical protein
VVVRQKIKSAVTRELLGGVTHSSGVKVEYVLELAR